MGCSDSRVPPEILFDQGIGDLFVVRSAGNVIDDIAIGSSIEYAVEKAKAKGQISQGCDILCSSVKGNARMVAEKIRTSSPVLTDSIENGILRVAGAYYELDSGVVSLTYKPVL